jgi:hypothetical protein
MHEYLFSYRFAEFAIPFRVRAGSSRLVVEFYAIRRALVPLTVSDPVKPSLRSNCADWLVSWFGTA